MSEARRHTFVRDGVALACVDFGGRGDAVVLLHGAAGSGDEWAETASWLRQSHRVLAPDQRGHGASERRPADVSRAACVADVIAWIDRLGAAPAVLVGQSLGGHTAMLTAAARSDLVSALVVAEASPAADETAASVVRRWLDSWPVPFASRSDALAFFGGETLWARTWVDGLEAGRDGLRPRFDPDVVERSLQELVESCWEAWARVVAPTLIVRAERGVAIGQVERMLELQPRATFVEVAGAQHDLHLEQPAAWRRALSSFLG